MPENLEPGRRWVLVHTGERPWTTNAERKWHPIVRARKVAEWRRAFGVLALEQRVPRLEAVRVRAWPLVADRRGMQDVGGCFPCVKACIDGLVDVGVLDDDGPARVCELTFTGSVVGDLDGLMLVVEELVVDPAPLVA